MLVPGTVVVVAIIINIIKKKCNNNNNYSTPLLQHTFKYVFSKTIISCKMYDGVYISSMLFLRYQLYKHTHSFLSCPNESSSWHISESWKLVAKVRRNTSRSVVITSKFQKRRGQVAFSACCFPG